MFGKHNRPALGEATTTNSDACLQTIQTEPINDTEIACRGDRLQQPATDAGQFVDRRADEEMT
jgi:hypothetical protein